jgi:hypothetical protein
MRTFYTESDIEDLAASGVRQLEVGPGVALTDAARQMAEELGIVLVTPGAAPTSKATLPISPQKRDLPQATRLPAWTVVRKRRLPKSSAAGGGPVVDQLAEAVSAPRRRRRCGSQSSGHGRSTVKDRRLEAANVCSLSLLDSTGRAGIPIGA